MFLSYFINLCLPTCASLLFPTFCMETHWGNPKVPGSTTEVWGPARGFLKTPSKVSLSNLEEVWAAKRLDKGSLPWLELTQARFSQRGEGWEGCSVPTHLPLRFGGTCNVFFPHHLQKLIAEYEQDAVLLWGCLSFILILMCLPREMLLSRGFNCSNYCILKT